MKKYVTMKDVAFFFVTLLSVIGCSSDNEGMPAENNLTLEEITFVDAFNEALDSCKDEIVFLVYECKTREYAIVDTRAYVFATFFNNLGNTSSTETYYSNDVKTRANDGWIFYKNIKPGVKAIKDVLKLSKMLPDNKTIEIRIEPREDGSKDVYYRIVDA